MKFPASQRAQRHKGDGKLKNDIQVILNDWHLETRRGVGFELITVRTTAHRLTALPHDPYLYHFTMKIIIAFSFVYFLFVVISMVLTVEPERNKKKKSVKCCNYSENLLS